MVGRQNRTRAHGVTVSGLLAWAAIPSRGWVELGRRASHGCACRARCPLWKAGSAVGPVVTMTSMHCKAVMPASLYGCGGDAFQLVQEKQREDWRSWPLAPPEWQWRRDEGSRCHRVLDREAAPRAVSAHVSPPHLGTRCILAANRYVGG
jgi:hypothetical protein